MRTGMPASSPSSPYFTLNVLAKGSLIAEGWIRDITMLPEVYVFPNQEALTMVDSLVDSQLLLFRVLRELHRDQGQKFESQLMQEVLQCQGISKTQTTHLNPQSDSMVE
jgi:hypothetical protein